MQNLPFIIFFYLQQLKHTAPSFTMFDQVYREAAHFQQQLRYVVFLSVRIEMKTELQHWMRQLCGQRKNLEF